jgi:hypothetical protein
MNSIHYEKHTLCIFQEYFLLCSHVLLKNLLDVKINGTFINQKT